MRIVSRSSRRVGTAQPKFSVRPKNGGRRRLEPFASGSRGQNAGALQNLRRPDPLHVGDTRFVRHYAARFRAYSRAGRDFRFQSPREKKSAARRAALHHARRAEMRPATRRARLRKNFFASRGRQCHVPRRRTHSWFGAGDFGHSRKRQKIPLAVHRRHRARWR